MGVNPTRTSAYSSPGSSGSSEIFLLSLFLTGPRMRNALLPRDTVRPTSCHCLNPLASFVPARSIRSWLPKDHLEEGFAGALIKALAHRSGSCFEEKSWTTFSSSELARSLQEAWGVVVA